MSAKKTAIAIISKGEVREKMKQIKDNEELLAKGQQYLISKAQEIIRLKAEVEGLSSADEALEKLLEEEIEALNGHPIVDKYYYENECMIVETTAFQAYLQSGESIDIAPMKISLNLLTSEVIGKSLVPGTGKRGYWSNDDPAPHFNGTNGHPCLGEASCTITDLISSQNYYASMLMVLEFVQSVNETDPAGKTYVKWKSGKADE